MYCIREINNIGPETILLLGNIGYSVLTHIKMVHLQEYGVIVTMKSSFKKYIRTIS